MGLLELLMLLFLCFPQLLALFSIPIYFINAPFLNQQHFSRHKRFVLTGHKWERNVLTWQLHEENLSKADIYTIRNSLVRAFTLWEEASQLLIFSEHIATHGRGKAAADVNIHFLVGEHGDGMPFDGPEGMIAHAFFPPVGELHLDAEEHWTLETGATGTNLYQTLLHEIGHLLGLGHSDDPDSVMFPRKKQSYDRTELSGDDVEAIQKLYDI